MSTATPTPVPPVWQALIDDAAVFPPGNSPLPDAVAAHLARQEKWYADLVGSFVVTDEAVPRVDAPVPLSVVVSGGAGAIPGALRLVARAPGNLAGLEVALRDPDDLAGNARRVQAAVDAARVEGLLADDTPVFVELPHVASSASWLAAADVAAESEFRLKFRTGGPEQHHIPTAEALSGWIDSALDRETAFKCTAGLHHAVRHTTDDGLEEHGFLNVLLATRQAFDGAARDDVVATLERRDADALVEDALAADLLGARRWFTSFGSCSVTEPLGDLIDLGILEKR